VVRLSEHLEVSIHTVDWNVRKLKADGKLRRGGPDKGGRWEIVE